MASMCSDTPRGLRARAVSLHMLAMGGLQPIGAFLAGTIGEHFGVGVSVSIGGAVIAMMVMVLVFRHRPAFQVS